MGLITIIGGTIGSAITAEQIDKLSKEISYIITRHQQLTNDMLDLKLYLKKLDYSSIITEIQSMNNRLSQNLENIMGDQVTKLAILANIDPSKSPVDPKSTGSYLSAMITIIGDICMMIAMVCATNPYTIVISGIMMTVTHLFGIFGLIKNLQTIDELQKVKADLEKFYEPGGQFDQQVAILLDLSVQMAENFYIFVVSFRNLVYELDANVNLLSLTENATNLNYQFYLDILYMNPFSPQFELDCLKLYQKFTEYKKNQKPDTAVYYMMRYIETQFLSKYDIPKQIQVAGQVASVFSSTTAIGKTIEKATAEVTKLAKLRDEFQIEFQNRVGKTVEQLMEIDLPLLKNMLRSADYEGQGQDEVLVVVAFYTLKFYADDETGDTLWGKNLKQVNEKTDNLNYLGANTGTNVNYIPQPQDPALLRKWRNMTDYLMDKYRKRMIPGHCQLFRLYMRMEAGIFYAGGEKSKMNYFYGIQVFQSEGQVGSQHKINFQQAPATEVLEGYQSQPQMVMFCAPPPPPEKQERLEQTDENLGTLCRFMAFIINGVAFPERVTDFSITKVEDKYKAVVEWKNRTVHPEMMDKMIKFSVTDLTEEDKLPQPEDASIFWRQIMQESNAKVEFKLK